MLDRSSAAKLTILFKITLYVETLIKRETEILPR